MKVIQMIEQECCPPLLGPALDAEEAESLAGALRIVADPARLRLLSLITNRPGGESCVCELTQPLGLSQPTVSHHLKVLHQAGLLDREKRGTWVYYRLIPDRLDALRSALSPAAPRPAGRRTRAAAAKIAERGAT